MTAAQARKLNELRENHNIDVCFFPVCAPDAKRYKFYIQRGNEVLWNPVARNEEGKVSGYGLFDSYEAGLKKAITQAMTFTK